MTSVSSPMRRPGDDRSPSARREPRDALPSGTLLGDGYRVERTLGQGGFGIVYLATDLALQRPMAIKEYLPVQLAGRGEGSSVGLREAGHKDAFVRGLQSFLREARLLAQFDHPSLVRVYRFWEENHTAYMAMPYCEGPTLQAARHTMLRPPDETWLREHLLLPLLGALQTLHEGQCLHRDVSPGNIILKPDGQPMLLDFGSARRVVADMTQPLTAILNPSYAAIEQYAESSTLPQGPWTDLYGLAAVAYYALSGRAPVPATVRAVNEAAMMPVAEVARVTERSFPGLHFTAPFLAAVDRALAVRPTDRPQTAQAMREALLSLHVQPDVTVEGAPLQAVPMNKDKAADAAPGAGAAAEENPQEAEAEKAIRAAIDAALADVADWPPMTRGRPQRVEPQFAPPPASAGKAALKVVPGGEAQAAPPAPTAATAEAAAAQEKPKAPAVATPPVRPVEAAPAEPEAVPPEAWAATAPAVAPIKVDALAASAPVAAAPVEAAAPAQPPAATPPAEPVPPESTPKTATRTPEPPHVDDVVALDETPSTEPLTEPLTEPALDFGRFDAAADADPPLPPRRARPGPWLAAAALAGLVALGAWYGWPEWNEGLRTAQAPAPAKPASAALPAETPAPVAAETAPPAAVATPSPVAVNPVAAAPSAPQVAAAPVPPAASAPATTEAAASDTPATPAAQAEDTATAEAPSEASPAPNSANSSGTARAPARKSTTVAATPRASSTRPKAAQHTATSGTAKAMASDPRSACGTRTNFSLYYCMKTQCRQPRFTNHPQCQRLRESDEVS